MTEHALGKIPADPVKSFFVHMLTRDISLQDAILDLLDNCVDGIQRAETKKTLEKKKPYDGYCAKISFSSHSFCIEDNCGGIPWDYHEYAFRMGRLKKDLDKGKRTVGTYGIGMKRAIFKIGQDCTIRTHARDKSYSVHFSPEWMKSESDWKVDALEIPPVKDLGTTIEVTQLYEQTQAVMGTEQFELAFREAVATHYAYIMSKGFCVTVNGKEVKPKAISLLFANIDRTTSDIRPFVYRARHKGVDIFLAVGFTCPIPSKEEAEQSLENYQERYSSAEAGWTVICNDRTVLYCDKTALTGWGVSGVPQYHMQFIAVSGIVMFSATAENASLLPTTTTKRGIDASSELYMHVRDKMIEGMKIFTQYTNQWKSRELVAESRQQFRKTPTVDVEDIQESASKLPMASTRGVISGLQYKPILPRPETRKTEERISFLRPVKDVRRVSTYLFDTPDKAPKDVGQKCFDLILEEAGK